MIKMERSIGTVGLTMVGLTSMIGSGWLFGSWRASHIAGPSAIFSWIIGMLIILTIAFCYGEQSVMFPESGGMVRFAQYSHGSFVGFLSGWALWLGAVTAMPIEAVASITYMSSWPWDWARNIAHTDGSLSTSGLFLAAVLMVAYFLLNYWTVKLFSRVNSLIMVFKLVIPIATVLGIIFISFHPSNLHSSGGFAPFGGASVFTAVASAGIIFSFSGFQNIFNLAGEAKNPAKSIPKALIASILITTVLYLCLQSSYILGMPTDFLEKGWNNINFNSPFANLLLLLNLNWLALLLYMDAFVSPSGTGITNTAATARMAYGMVKNGHMPKFVGKLHEKYHIPRPALWLNLIIGFAFLFVFRGWGSLADMISGLIVISFMTGPISAMGLRMIGKDLHRPLRIKGLQFIAPVGFIFASLAFYWSHWPLTGELGIIMLVGLPFYLYFESKKPDSQVAKDFKAGYWFIGYLVFLTLVSFIGSKDFGGIGVIPYGLDMLVVAAGSLCFYQWGVKSAIVTKYYEYAKQLNQKEVEEEIVNINKAV